MRGRIRSVRIAFAGRLVSSSWRALLSRPVLARGCLTRRQATAMPAWYPRRSQFSRQRPKPRAEDAVARLVS